MQVIAECRLPGYRCRCRIFGFERMRNHGPLLTVAIGEWIRDGIENELPEHWKPIRDIASRMKLADMLSHLHELPVNAVKLYGTSGRGCAVGRLETCKQ